MAGNIKGLKNVAIRMVEQPAFLSDEKVDNPAAAVRVLANELKDYDREVLCMVNLTTKGRPINASIVSMGIIDGSLVHPREVMKAAVLSNAAQIIMLHNHPSGDVTPSKQDIAITDRMVQVCDLMGIPLADHIIVGNMTYFSFREKKMLDIQPKEYTTELQNIKFSSKVAESKKDSVVGKVRKLKDEVQKADAGTGRQKANDMAIE